MGMGVLRALDPYPPPTHTRGSEKDDKKYTASSGNRTRAARVAGEHSTTEPTMLDKKMMVNNRTCLSENGHN